jgi:dTMP kinase
MGKLIVFEGIDGSGKSTQFKLLCKSLDEEGRDYIRLVFPQYSEPSSALIRMYLGGEFGSSPSDVNPYAASSFYAVDRYASYKKVWQSAYEKGTPIVTDRYTTANAIHQAAKLEPEQMPSFFKWLYEYEFSLLGLPVPDLVIYFSVPVSVAENQIAKRQAETGALKDIHENDSLYLRRCQKAADAAAEFFGWSRICCAPDGAMKNEENIHREVKTLVEKIL